MSHISFTREGFEAFRANARPGPIHMLNLVQLREVAAYEDGTEHEAGVSGAEAYATYGRLTGPVLARVGGHLVWNGVMEQMLIGPQGKTWDLCFIVEYPDQDAFLKMLGDPEYQQAVAHRQAAVLDSRLIRMAPMPVGDKFGATAD